MHPINKNALRDMPFCSFPSFELLLYVCLQPSLNPFVRILHKVALVFWSLTNASARPRFLLLLTLPSQ